jgi:hypothetical protein
MDPNQLREILDKYYYYILFANIGVGLLLGLAPLILGLRRKKRNLGFAGFASACILGALSPLLSLLAAIVFTILIVKKSAGKNVSTDVESVVNSENI